MDKLFMEIVALLLDVRSHYWELDVRQPFWCWLGIRWIFSWLDAHYERVDDED